MSPLATKIDRTQPQQIVRHKKLTGSHMEMDGDWMARQLKK